MAYNNVFPMTYNPYYPQYQAPMQPTQSAPPTPGPINQQAPQSNLIWVQGEAGAKSYLVAPNTTVQLWDSEAQTIYLKSADGSGMPSMKVLDYTIRDSAGSVNSPVAPQNVPKTEDYVTRQELHDLEAKLSKMVNKSLTRDKRFEEVDDDE